MPKRLFFVWSSIFALALAAACGGGGDEATTGLPPAPTPTTGAGGFDMSKATATVSGKMVFEGTPPAAQRIQMSADPFCAMHSKDAMTEEVVVSDGGLENVIVYVKSGIEGMTFSKPAQPVVIDQQGCRYHPHVFTMMTNQPLEIRNSDSTLHNIHAWAEKNTPFNIGQPVKDMKTVKTFDKEEMPLPIRCDVHRWMGAFVGVFSHPFHTVSKQGGTYELKLPPGKYEIVAWHEKYGTQTQTLEVKDNEKKDLSFTFKAS
jgi:hypothetical protein